MITSLDDFIEKYYSGITDEVMPVVVMDNDGIVKYISPFAMNKARGGSPASFIGKHFTLGSTNEMANKLKIIHKHVLEHETVVNYIIIPQHQRLIQNNVFGARYTQMPIFNQHGIVIGVLVIGVLYYFVSLEELLLGKNISVNNDVILSLKLTDMQHGIIFLLANGYTQEDVAKHYAISRGAVLRITVDTIADKLGIDLASGAYEVIRKARALNLHNYVPANLIKHHIICTNYDINLEDGAI